MVQTTLPYFIYCKKSCYYNGGLIISYAQSPSSHAITKTMVIIRAQQLNLDYTYVSFSRLVKIILRQHQE